MLIAILCLKVDQKQVCEQLLYIEDTEHLELLAIKSIYTETIIDVLLADAD